MLFFYGNFQENSPTFSVILNWVFLTLEGTFLVLPKLNFADNVLFVDGANESQRKDLQSELNVMKELAPHKHVVELLACITKSGMNFFGGFLHSAVIS